jgi:hypothetical protein
MEAGGTGASAVMWECWVDGNGSGREQDRRWLAYPATVSTTLEVAFAAGQSSVAFSHRGSSLAVDFRSMEQANATTGFRRKVRRSGPSTKSGSAPLPPKLARCPEPEEDTAPDRSSVRAMQLAQTALDTMSRRPTTPEKDLRSRILQTAPADGNAASVRSGAARARMHTPAHPAAAAQPTADAKIRAAAAEAVAQTEERLRPAAESALARVALLEAELAAERETSAQSQAKAAAEAEERLQAAVASAQAAVQVESSQLTAKASEAETRVASLEAELAAERETSAQSQAKAAAEAGERLQAAVASAQAAVQVESSQLTAKASEAETRVALLEAELAAERETSAQSQAKAADEAVRQADVVAQTVRHVEEASAATMHATRVAADEKCRDAVECAVAKAELQWQVAQIAEGGAQGGAILRLRHALEQERSDHLATKAAAAKAVALIEVG